MRANSEQNTTEDQVMPPPETTLARGLYKIVLGSTALALGGMAAALQALRPSATGFGFRISVWTIVAFAVGWAAGLLYWKLEAKSRLAGRIGNALLLLAGLGGFLYPLRFVPADKKTDIGIGLGLAVCAVSMGAFLLWRMKRFFDKDNAAVERKSE